MGDLLQLTYMDLGSNTLSGTLPTEIGRTAGSAGAEDALALAPAQQRFLDSVVHQSRAIASGVRFGQRRFVRLWRLATALFGRGSCHRFARL